MNLLLTGFVGGIIGGGVLGYWLASHIHQVASAAVRAVTIPSGVQTAISGAVPAAGSALADASKAAQTVVGEVAAKAGG